MGLGFHPFFPDAASATVRFAARSFWLEGPDKLPTEPISLPPELDHANSRRFAAWRNNSYDGWDGTATIEWDDGRHLTMTTEGALPYLHVYHPPGLGFFCLEPQTHLSGAPGLPDGEALGMRMVKPGETMSVGLRLSAYTARH